MQKKPSRKERKGKQRAGSLLASAAASGCSNPPPRARLHVKGSYRLQAFRKDAIVRRLYFRVQEGIRQTCGEKPFPPKIGAGIDLMRPAVPDRVSQSRHA